MKFVAAFDPDATPALEQARKMASADKGGRVRGVTVSGPLTRSERLAQQSAEPVDEERPRTRADCENGQRPCPWVSCRYHLFLDVHHGHLKFNFPDRGPLDLETTCSLDIADNGGGTLEEVGLTLNLTRERVRQCEEAALFKIRRNTILREIAA